MRRDQGRGDEVGPHGKGSCLVGFLGAALGGGGITLLIIGAAVYLFWKTLVVLAIVALVVYGLFQLLASWARSLD